MAQADETSYACSMGREAAKLLAEALKLPVEDRAAVAGQLLRSLDEQVDEDAEAAWIEEIGRRLRELDAGAVEAVTWSQARDRIASDDPKR
jgi:putative addiction module component (TIGR02574 family)